MKTKTKNGEFVLHIAGLATFIPGYIALIRKNFEQTSHVFITLGDFDRYSYQVDSDTYHYGSFKQALSHIIAAANKADKIIFHGLFDWSIPQALMAMPWIHRKCHWVMWGGDLYFHQINRGQPYWHNAERYRKPFIAGLAGLITYVEGDYQRAVEWYGAVGRFYECIMYTSNIFSGPPPLIAAPKERSLTLLVGNSADPTNNHQEIFSRLKTSPELGLVDKIYCPLSYGNPEYARSIIALGGDIFPGKFIALTEFMPIEQYKSLLQKVDVAIFAHNRQQAMGNIVNLLGMGKRVIMREGISSWDCLKGLGASIYPLHEMGLSPLEESAAMRNYEVIMDYFSEEKLVDQWRVVFSSYI